MKPIQLTINAFGSYGSEQVIDFTKPVQNLFLVTGDTGAGKSTIFDAIVFALYGQVSSSDHEKKGEKMVSQFAEPGAVPYVEMTFLEGGQEYTVYRQPRYYGMKKNGEVKETATSEKVQLTMPDGTEYPSKETNQKLIELVGLTKEQFMQIAMIAQGEFMQVLKESTNNKKEIFRKLFNTEIYDKIKNELDLRVKDKSRELAKIKTECIIHVKNSRIPENVDYEALAHIREKLSEEITFDMGLLTELTDRLEILCSDLKKDEERLAGELGLAVENHVAVNKQIATAQQLIQQYDLLAEAEDTLQSCKDREADIRYFEKLKQMIPTAYRIKGFHDRFIEIKQMLDEETEKFEGYTQKLPLFIEAAKKAQEDLAAGEKEKSGADAEYTRTKALYDRSMEQFKIISGLDNKLTKTKAQIDRYEKAYDAAEKSFHDFLEQERLWKERSLALEGADVRYERTQNYRERYQQLHERFLILNRLGRDITVLTEEIRQKTKAFQEAERTYNQAHDAYDKAWRLYLSSQAGIIARELEDEKPCPVCGSLHHPSPCQIGDDLEYMTKEYVDHLSEEEKRLKGELESCADRVKQIRISCDEKISIYDNDLKTLFRDFHQLAGDCQFVAASYGEDSNREAFLNKEFSKLDSKLTEDERMARKDASELAEIRKKLQAADDNRNRLQSEKENALKILQDAQKQYSSDKRELETHRKQLDFKSEAEAEDAYVKCSKKRTELLREYNTRQQKYVQANEQVAACQSSMEDSRKRILAYEKNTVIREQSYEEAMISNHMQEEEWSRITRDYSDDISNLESEINAWKEKQTSALTQKEQAIRSINGQAKPDLTALESVLQDAESKKKHLEQARAEASQLYKTNRDVLDRLLPKMEERKKVYEEHKRLNSLYNVLAGKNKNAKMDLETFAQRHYLEQILYAANKRFEVMSAGQYELRICDIDRANEGKNRGLDLMVYSRITGKEREVRTLSGGESFMAALSLALGMADEIQAKSAAVNLDIMFIDEGFGSLDDHSRNEAVKVLKTMAGGSKLIGIISHVTELKQEIDDLLVVTKDDKGSRANWRNS